MDRQELPENPHHRDFLPNFIHWNAPVPQLNRRTALAITAAVSAGVATGTTVSAQDTPAKAGFGPLCLFAKPLQWLTFTELTDLLDRQQWDGIEATIRSGGQVDPERVTEDLPRLVETLATKDKQVTIMASDINSVDQPLTEKVLEVAAKLGIKQYRMKYYKYDMTKPILPQLDKFILQMENLATLNHELGMTALYQNHAGLNYFGAGLWDLYRAASELPNEEIAVAFDVRHATAEAGQSWPIHWKMLKPFVGALYFKDFEWQGAKVENVPLGEGLVKKSFYADLKSAPMSGVPVSVHMEYVDHKKPELIGESVKALAADRLAIRKLLGV